MTKPVSTSKKPRKQHTPEFRQEALKLAERITGEMCDREPPPRCCAPARWSGWVGGPAAMNAAATSAMRRTVSVGLVLGFHVILRDQGDRE